VVIPGDQPDAAIAALFRSRRGCARGRAPIAPGLSDVGHDKIEAVGTVSIANMFVFEVDTGEVKQIDTPYP
jgi:hypothetical protein